MSESCSHEAVCFCKVIHNDLYQYMNFTRRVRVSSSAGCSGRGSCSCGGSCSGGGRPHGLRDEMRCAAADGWQDGAGRPRVGHAAGMRYKQRACRGGRAEQRVVNSRRRGERCRRLGMEEVPSLVHALCMLGEAPRQHVRQHLHLLLYGCQLVFQAGQPLLQRVLPTAHV